MGNLAGFTAHGDSPNNGGIFAGQDDPQTRQITLFAGENRKRGTVLGKISAGGVADAAAAAKAGGNAANTGVLTLANPKTGAGVKAGVYKVRMIEPGSNAGTFVVEDPDGIIVGEGTVAVAFDGPVKFTIADGAQDFVAGEGFDITVTLAAPANNGKYKMSLSAASDGSAAVKCILAEDCDASLGDKVTIAHFGGVYDENALIYGTGHTAASVREELRDLGIKLQSSIAR